jgi:hypothetical protein
MQSAKPLPKSARFSANFLNFLVTKITKFVSELAEFCGWNFFDERYFCR